MKKVFSIALTLALLLLCVCTAETVGMANPVTECDSLDELNELLGCHLQSPGVMGVEDEAYRLISTGELFDIGEYCFRVNGMHYCYRFCANYDDDISGVWKDGSTVFQGQVRETEYAAADGMKLARWANVDGQYALCVTDDGAMDQAQFEGIVEEIMSSSMAPESDAFGSFETVAGGTYFDAYSQRASAEVEELEDGSCAITVSWANSASEACVWTMDAVPDEDGRLNYDNCTKMIVTYNEDDSESVETIYENGAGFFTVTDGTLYWNGAAEEDCMNCMFEPEQ